MDKCVYVVVGRNGVKGVFVSFELAQEWVNKTYKPETPVAVLPAIETWLVEGDIQ